VAWALHWDSDVGAHANRGFTLIEMMVVVVIVGVLATLAVVGYRKIVQSSHVSEATGMIQNIRVAQEAYKSETQLYANISTDNGLCPQPPAYGVQTGWNGACGPGPVYWSALPLHVDGPVLFGYATRAGTSTDTPPTVSYDGASVAMPAGVNTDWYVAWAAADLDNVSTTVTLVVGASWSNQLSVVNEGQ
jgi:type IV pilus assembly protein PilA